MSGIADAADGVVEMFGRGVRLGSWAMRRRDEFTVVVCESESAIGTSFFTTAEKCLVGLLVSTY